MTQPMQHGPASRRHPQVYATIGLETQVLGAGREHLITLLFDGARAALVKARLHMESNHVAQRGAAISTAIEIIETGLMASIDHEAGGELATNLAAIYGMIIRNLLWANLNVDVEKLDLARHLLDEIGDAWRIAAATARGGPGAP